MITESSLSFCNPEFYYMFCGLDVYVSGPWYQKETKGTCSILSGSKLKVGR